MTGAKPDVLALYVEPLAPRLFGDREVGQKLSPIKAARRIQSFPAAIVEERFEPRHVGAVGCSEIVSPLLISVSFPSTRPRPSGFDRMAMCMPRAYASLRGACVDRGPKIRHVTPTLAFYADSCACYSTYV